MLFDTVNDTARKKGKKRKERKRKRRRKRRRERHGLGIDMKISNGARVNGGREPLEKPIYDRLNSKYAAHGAPFRPCNGQPKNQRSSIEWPPRQALDPNAFAKYLSSGRSRSNTQTRARERQRKRESRETVINRERERERASPARWLRNFEGVSTMRSDCCYPLRLRALIRLPVN